MIKRLLMRRPNQFRAREDGSIALEAVIITPMLFWTLMAGYTFFEAYRQSASNIKAAHTIGDLISRETREINNTYIDSMEEMFSLMVANQTDLKIRISLVLYDEASNSHSVNWSAIRGGFTEKLTDANIGQYKDALPPISDQNTLILVETSNTFVPFFSVGLGNIELENFIFTRPRFANNIKGNV
ncbi:TadE/TadG family type IV pilus assembly protein [Ruegeria arenilitoris]|uniref:TadE/TadG family type IV pilus assembly protein n=1 Tax=Ruegeria arenilitoris TaxID=1173585 RepID=UPI00148048CD|nr:pilus assembly protein [Ruegeria arenilitoris]